MEGNIDTWSIGATSNVRTMDKQQADNVYFHGNQEKSYLSHGIEQIVDNLASSNNSQNSQIPQSQSSTSIYQPYNLKDSNSDSSFSFTAESLKVSSLAIPSIPYIGTPDRQTYQRDIQIQPGSIEALLNYPSSFPSLSLPTTKDNLSLKNLKYPLLDTSLQSSSSFTGFNGKDTGLAMLSSLAHTRTPLTEPAEQKKPQRLFNTSSDLQGLFQHSTKDTRKSSLLNVTENDKTQTSIIPQLQSRVLGDKERQIPSGSTIVEPVSRLLDVNNFNILSFVDKNENQSIYEREDNTAAEVISITVENVPYSNAESNILYYPDTEVDKTIHITNVIDDPNVCMEDKQSEKYVYNCGACDLIYGTMCNLLMHLESHGSYKSFLYNRESRTAYPQFGFVNVEVQTDEELMFERTRMDYEDTYEACIEMNPNNKGQCELEEMNASEMCTSNIPDLEVNKDNKKEQGLMIETYLQKDKHIDNEIGNIENLSEYEDTDPKDPDYKPDNYLENNVDTDEEFPDMINEEKKMARKPVTKNKANKKISRNKESILVNKSVKKGSENEDNSQDKRTKHLQTKVSPNKASAKKELIQCSLCQEKFELPIRLKKHLESVHGISKIYKCRVCPVQVKSYEELEEHRVLHKNQEHRCKLCDKVVSSAASLRDHMNFHMGIKPHECKTCGNSFRTTGQLNTHVREKHDKTFSQMCESCGKTFYSRNQIREHRKQCLEIKPHKCNTCDKRFIRSTQLRVHERTHSGEKPYVCDICGSALTNYSSLIKHKRIHTGEKPYKCEKCSMAFTAKTTLNDHLKTHTQDKPYQCQFCERSFIKKWNLKTHVRQHTGETPYKCKICGQGYKQNVLLKTHMQIHNKSVVVEPGTEAEKLKWTTEHVHGCSDGLQVESDGFQSELITHSL